MERCISFTRAERVAVEQALIADMGGIKDRLQWAIDLPDDYVSGRYGYDKSFFLDSMNQNFESALKALDKVSVVYKFATVQNYMDYDIQVIEFNDCKYYKVNPSLPASIMSVYFTIDDAIDAINLYGVLIV